MVGVGVIEAGLVDDLLGKPGMSGSRPCMYLPIITKVPSCYPFGTYEDLEALKR